MLGLFLCAATMAWLCLLLGHRRVTDYDAEASSLTRYCARCGAHL